jgi:poly(A) polymerase
VARLTPRAWPPAPRSGTAWCAWRRSGSARSSSSSRPDRLRALVDLGVADPELRLAALLPDDPVAAGQVAAALRLSNKLRDRLVAALAGPAPLAAAMTDAEARRALYDLGGAAVADRARLAAAADPAAKDGWLRIARLAERWRRPVFPLSGADVAALGVPRGPQVGQLLRDAEAWWAANDFASDRETLLARLKAAAASP